MYHPFLIKNNHIGIIFRTKLLGLKNFRISGKEISGGVEKNRDLRRELCDSNRGVNATGQAWPRKSLKLLFSSTYIAEQPVRSRVEKGGWKRARETKFAKQGSRKSFVRVDSKGSSLASWDELFSSERRTVHQFPIDRSDRRAASNAERWCISEQYIIEPSRDTSCRCNDSTPITFAAHRNCAVKELIGRRGVSVSLSWQVASFTEATRFACNLPSFRITFTLRSRLNSDVGKLSESHVSSFKIINNACRRYFVQGPESFSRVWIPSSWYSIILVWSVGSNRNTSLFLSQITVHPYGDQSKLVS